jgi:hypothetical protein
MNSKRYAKIPLPSTQQPDSFARMVGQYMPSNYRVLAIVVTDSPGYVLIGGTDNAGWTLDLYVLPRLQSGMIYGCELSVDDVLMELDVSCPACGQLVGGTCWRCA